MLQDWILSQDPMGNMAPNKWEDYIFDVSRSTEPKDMPAKKVVNCVMLSCGHCCMWCRRHGCV